jgi:chitin synthase
MELVLVRNLCGIFCCSMQFLVLIELIGTVILPAAIFFTFVMIADTATTAHLDASKLIPLFILILIIALPGVLVLLTTRKVVYLYWFLIYLIALPIWNFALPVYAFWHMDDFSWGSTRKVDGEGKGSHSHGHNDDGGESDAAQVPKKKWAEWDRYRRLYQETLLEWD